MEETLIAKLDNFFNSFNKHTYKKGDVLIAANQEPLGVFLLKKGVVRMYSISPKGEELNLNVFKAVSFFPMNLILNNSSNNYYYEAMEDAEVMVAPKEQFKKFLQSEPKVVWDLLFRIYRGLEGFYLRMEYLMEGSAQDRLITEILISAKRFGKQEPGRTVINLKLTENDLAALSGISRETVSREIQKLKKKRFIDFHNNILVVKDFTKLEEELGS